MIIPYSSINPLQILLLWVYVDDIMLTGSNTAQIEHVKQHHHKCFGIKDLGRLDYFLGLEVSYVHQGIVLSQKKFTHELLKESGLDNSKPVSTPLRYNCKLSQDEGDPISVPTYYRALVGKINFLTDIKPDLSFTAQTPSQCMQHLRSSYLQASHYTLRYIMVP